MNHNFKIDFIGIGAQKAGTTWLARCLSEHPEVCFSKKKEINFFNKTYQFYIKNEPWNYKKGTEWYAHFFNNCAADKLKGEFSVQYLYDQETPKLIKKHYPDAKLILVLRNPADQVYSAYLHALSQYKLPSFTTMVENKSHLIEYAYYSKYIENYLAYFNREQILILLFDEIKNNPLSVVKKTYEFLNIDKNFVPEVINKIINITGPKTTAEIKTFFIIRNFFIRNLKNIIKIDSALGKILLHIDKNIRKVLYKISARKKSYKQLDKKLREKLQKIYSDDILKTQKLINVNLDNWLK